MKRGIYKDIITLLRLLAGATFILLSLAINFPVAQVEAAEPSFLTPALPEIPSNVFNVTRYGAIADGVATNTIAIQAAIDAASSNGGGIVELPAGVFLSGPLRFSSQVNLKLDTGAVLRMLPLDKYPGGTTNPADFISGSGLHDIAITGSGTIDGQGAPWWPFARTRGARRPRMIALSGSHRVLIEGILLSNSPMFHIAIRGSTDVTVRQVTIRAPASDDPINPSHNTDACDVSGHRVLVQDCDVSVGDDDFTCGGGTSDVLITNCTYGNGHGVSIGSPTSGGVSNLTVVNCTFSNTDCGIRIKSDRDRGGLLQNLHYENLRMTNVGFPILIYASYMAKAREFRDLENLTPETAARYPAASVTRRTPIYQDIIFKNITATAQPGHRAGLIWGLPEMAVSNVVLDEIKIKADKPFGIFDAKNVKLSRVQITTPPGVQPLVTTNSQIEKTGF